MLAIFQLLLGVNEHDFRKCRDTPFCEQHRALAEDAAPWRATSVVSQDNDAKQCVGLTATLEPPDASRAQLSLVASVSVLTSGAVRVHIDEHPSTPLEELTKVDPAVKQPEGWDEDMDGPWDAPMLKLGRAIKQRFVPTEALLPGVLEQTATCVSTASADSTTLRCDAGPKVRLVHEPFRVELLHAATDKVLAVFNGRGRLAFNSFRQSVATDAAEAEKSDPVRFNSFTDSQPFGSPSVGVDVDFPAASHVYGIPERTVAHDLPSTLGKEPYRLMNLDVFEYELDHQMGIYGSVPFVQAHGEHGAQGLLWLNPSETFVDVGCAGGTATGGVCTHWMSAASSLDAYLFSGETPGAVTRQHAALTGTTPLPPLFALGYHQCRWNYKDEEDVSNVHAKFEEHNLPFDVLWLDIEHTDRKRYFSWDEDKFPTPLRMQAELARTGRKMVTIIDPHLRAEDDYAVYAKAKERNLLVRTADNSSHFEGECWPGNSAWVDYLQPAARDYWASLFTPDAYAGSSATLYTWNDMNEPSVFKSVEITMPPTLMHHDADGVAFEHRELHNMYGMFMTMATQQGQKLAYPTRRPFVLTRAFFAGSQRYAAVWTGDNKASWAHLAASTPMLLSLSVAGIPFVGADVGGFFGNPDPSLLVRWYQAAVFHPFLRAHAEFKTKRREPWLFGDEVTRQVRVALSLRYALLPYLYTCFAAHARDGTLVMRPMWWEFPGDPALGGTASWSKAVNEAQATKAKREAEAKAKAEAQAKEDAEAAAKAESEDGAAAADGENEAMAAEVDEERALSEEDDDVENVNGDDSMYKEGYEPEGGESEMDEAAEEVGECPCSKCDDTRCYPPDCQRCGTKESSGCIKEDGTVQQWGCYTAADAECDCNETPQALTPPKDDGGDDYSKYGEDDEDDDKDDEDDDKYRGMDDDDDDTGGGDTDYNQEYYHGEAKDGDQEEGQLQTAEQFMLGSHILVQPITAKGCSETQVYLPAADRRADAVWYDLHTYTAIKSTVQQRVFDVPTHSDRVPAYLRGGAVLPRRDRPRRSSSATHTDPFTLVVAPDVEGHAGGSLYADGYDGYEHVEQGMHTEAVFRFARGAESEWSFESVPRHGNFWLGPGEQPLTTAPQVGAAASRVERVVILGSTAPKEVQLRRKSSNGDGVDSSKVRADFDPVAQTLTVRLMGSGVTISDEWSLAFG